MSDMQQYCYKYANMWQKHNDAVFVGTHSDKKKK